ncbi:MAG: hypothetical protein IKU19_09835, partial [Clostridia bacterium]|nr:hypothetical protein [Clostridia bacterium]
MSFVVALVTAWNLRITGVTIANSASCGYEEHHHIESCFQDDELICEKQEHIHNTGCYSDPKADTETSLDWDSMFANYPYTGILREDLVGIAKTQVGYTESQLNFEVGDTGERKGYTRYGTWYGAPYNDWSAIFVSFCLNYAGANFNEFPNSSGAASMAELWKTTGKYIPVGQYTPQSGDIVFYNNNTAGIVTEVYGATFCVIRGDVQNTVTSDVMSLGDPSIEGWGSTATHAPQDELPQDELPQDELPQDDVPDISNGPIFFITVGSEEQMQMQMQPFSLRAVRS